MRNFANALLIVFFSLLLSVNAHSTQTTPDSSNTRTTPTINPKAPATFTSYNPSTKAQDPLDSSKPFDELPGCPGDPVRLALSADWPTAAACPRLNDKWPSPAASYGIYNGQEMMIPQTPIRDPLKGELFTPTEVYCPSNCTASRHITTNPQGKITSVREAVCPAGYVVAATYNMQPEVKYLTSNLEIPAPIFWTDYVKYKSQGYTCNANTQAHQRINQCVPSNSSTYTVYASRITVGGMGQHDSMGPPMQNEQGYAGQYNTTDTDNKGGYCFLANADNACNIYSGIGWPHPGQADCLGGGYLVKVDYDFFYFSCSMPAGNYVQTSHQVPTSIVCSRISTEWTSPSP